MDWLPGRWISLLLTIPVLFYFGSHFFVNAWKQAKSRKANMDTLVSLSTGIAFIFSSFNTIFPQVLRNQGLEPHVYFEAAVVIITFISFGKLLEERAKSSTSASLKKANRTPAKDADQTAWRNIGRNSHRRSPKDGYHFGQARRKNPCGWQSNGRNFFCG